MKSLLSALSRLSELSGGQPAIRSWDAPSYKKIIQNYLASPGNDIDVFPEADRGAGSYQRRSMTANFSR